MDRPSDPVIDFILDRHTYDLIMKGSEHWPWSRLSASRLTRIGYTLICLRCAQLGLDKPSRDDVSGWWRRS